MKKNVVFTLILSAFFAISVNAQQKTMTSKEAKQIAADLNKAVEKIDASLENIDWNAFGNILSQTIVAMDKNADALTEIVKNIDLDKINASLEKISTKIEMSIDSEKLEKQLQELGEKIEKSIPKENDK
jgi:hypothetical protein